MCRPHPPPAPKKTRASLGRIERGFKIVKTFVNEKKGPVEFGPHQHLPSAFLHRGIAPRACRVAHRVDDAPICKQLGSSTVSYPQACLASMHIHLQTAGLFAVQLRRNRRPVSIPCIPLKVPVGILLDFGEGTRRNNLGKFGRRASDNSGSRYSPGFICCIFIRPCYRGAFCQMVGSLVFHENLTALSPGHEILPLLMVHRSENCLDF